MKRVLFVSVTEYDFKDEQGLAHLRPKFEGLSKGAEVFVLARGKPFRKKIWGCSFYLLPNKWLFRLYAFKFAFWLCLIKKIDIVIAQSPLFEGFIGVILKKMLGKKLIVEAHGDWLMRPALANSKATQRAEEHLVPSLARFSLKRADAIRAISSFTKKQVQFIAPNKPVYVFPTFTDLSLFLNEPQSELGSYILFVGRLQKIKGVNFLLDAFKKLSSRFEKFKLVIVGDGEELENLKKQAQELGLGERVVFKGKLTLEQTRDEMKNCYCLVLPSLTEGLGRVLIEAGALAKPLIGSRTGGIVDLIIPEKNGFLTEPGKTNDLIEKLSILLDSKEKAQKMGRESRRMMAENFSNQKYIAHYLQMLNSL